VENKELLEAYAVLDLPETATKEDAENRYFLLLKKSKRNGQLDTSAISKAYTIIVENERTKDITKYEETHYAGSKSRQAFDQFWTNYKLHVIVSAVLLILIIVGINSYLDKRAEKIALSKLPPADIEVMFVGEFFTPEDYDLGQSMLAYFPDWQRIKTFISYNPETPQDQFDIYSSQKNLINLMTEKPQVYITDKFNYSILVSQGAFMDLQQWIADIPAERLVMGQREEDGKPFVYGIDVSENAVFKDLKLLNRKPETIASIRFDSPDTDNAIRFIKSLLGID